MRTELLQASWCTYKEKCSLGEKGSKDKDICYFKRARKITLLTASKLSSIAVSSSSESSSSLHLLKSVWRKLGCKKNDKHITGINHKSKDCDSNIFSNKGGYNVINLFFTFLILSTISIFHSIVFFLFMLKLYCIIPVKE